MTASTKQLNKLWTFQYLQNAGQDMPCKFVLTFAINNTKLLKVWTWLLIGFQD